jgi:hypothetical protein
MSSHGVSMSIRRSLQQRSKSRWHSSPRSPWKGLITPLRIVSEGSGTARSRSSPITRPKPRHFGQAPSGLLKENKAGDGGRSELPVAGFVQVEEKSRTLNSGPEASATCPLPSVKACSSASIRRVRLSGVTGRRSWITAIERVLATLTAAPGSSVR